MKKIIILLFLWNSCYSQGIFVPVNPTVYGSNNQRVKAILALLIPNKDTLLNTNDTTGTSQIFYRPQDSTFWGWSHNTGYVKLSGNGKGNDSAFVALMQALDSSYALFVHSDRSIPADTLVVVGASGSTTDARPYKSYTAILNQSGTGAPSLVATLENTTGVTMTYARVGTGWYTITASSPIFTSGHTYIFTQCQATTPMALFENTSGGVSSFNLITRKTDGTSVDDILSNAIIEIRVYP